MISVITPSIRPQFLDMTQKCLEEQTSQDFEWCVELGLRNRGYTLPTDWNKLIRRAKGDIIFILQDCITIPKDALEKVALLDHTKIAYTYPVGKEPTGGGDTQWDWRHFKKNAAIQSDHWETDLASAPKSLLYDVGGFDELYCAGWSWENVEIAYRAEAAGYSFRSSDATNGIALDHDAIVDNPFRNKRENNDKRAHQTYLAAQTGNWKLDYL